MAGADIRAGRAFVELYVKNASFFKHLNAAGERLQKFGQGITNVGARAFAAGSAITAPLIAATTHFAKAGDQIQKMSVRTGFSAEALSELGFAAEQSGTSLESLGAGLFRMERRVANAATETGPAVRALKELGLNARTLSQLSPEQQFEIITDSLAGMTDETRAAQLAFEVFGDNARDLMPLLKEGSAGMAALRQEARDLGLSISQQDADAAAELGDAWNRVTRTVKAATFSIGSALAPAITTALGVVKGFVIGIGNWIKENAALVRMIAAVGVGIAAVGAALVGLGVSITLIGTAFSAVSAMAGTIAAALAFIMSPVGLIIAGVAAATVAVFRFRDSLGAVGEMVDGIAAPLRDFAGGVAADFQAALGDFQNAWSGLVDAIKAGDLELAAQIAWAGLELVWLRGTQTLNELWLKAKFFAIETWQNFKTELAQIFTVAFAGVQSAWARTVAFVQSTWTTLTTSLANAWNKAQAGVGNMIINAARASGVISDEFANAWRESLNQPLESRIAQRSQDAAARQAEIESRLQGQLATIEANAAGTIGALEADRQRALDALATAQGDERLAAAERLLAAERRLAELRGTASEKAREVERKRKEEDEAAETAAGGAGARQIAVSFSAAGLLALGAGAQSPQKDMAQQTREMRREMVEQNRLQKRAAAAAERTADQLAQVMPFKYG